MKFRPCIDLHDGVVKQIVGSTLTDAAASSATLVTNFVATTSAADYARMYAAAGLTGGHVIMLGRGNEEAATSALAAFPGGLQVGGGITPTNAPGYLAAGASHVIVTSYVFRDGRVDYDRLAELVSAVGRERLVLDLSCRRRPAAGGGTEYVVVTDRWCKFTDMVVSPASLTALAAHCAEFLVHGVDVEGMRMGVEAELVALLGEHSPIPVTYAGGVRDMADLELVRTLGRGRVDVSVGSALDIFGGSLPFAHVVAWSNAQSAPAPAPAAPGGGASGELDLTILHESTPGGGVFFIPHTGSPGGKAARLAYTWAHPSSGGDGSVPSAPVMDMTTTVVEEVLRGQGIAGKLAVAAFDHALAHGARVIPTCRYLRDSFVPKNPKYAAIVVAADGKL